MIQLVRALFFRVLRKIGFVDLKESMVDQNEDRFTTFDEYPNCDICGSSDLDEVMVTADGSRIVKCNSCEVMFTSPRIDERKWIEWLRKDTERSKIFTENRLKYGVALSSNIKYVFPFWKKILDREYNKIFDRLEKYSGKDGLRIHDVGCGVGHLLKAAESRGYTVSGNELNQYACDVMNRRLGLKVYNETLSNVQIDDCSLDAIIMRDYIEHSYHPFMDSKKSYELLRVGGLLYVETFKTDCQTYEQLKGDWNMLFWNHSFHFESKSLCEMLKKSGFDILSVKGDYNSTLVYIYAIKSK